MPFNLSEKTVDALLDKLGNDDGFRTQFQANPRQALASLGHAPAADKSVGDGAWACMSVKQLASKEAIQASRAALRQQLLTTQAAQHPVNLEVAKP